MRSSRTIGLANRSSHQTSYQIHGALGETRTRTNRVLRPVTLPIGLQGRILPNLETRYVECR